MMCAFNTIAFESQLNDCMIDKEETLQCFLKILLHFLDILVNKQIQSTTSSNPSFLGGIKI